MRRSPVREVGFPGPRIAQRLLALGGQRQRAGCRSVGSAWFDPASLDILRLEVRVDDAPRSVRIAATRETTTVPARPHRRRGVRIAGSPPKCMLRDRDGSELLNRSRFDQYRRFTGSSTVSYAPAGDAPAAAAPPRPRAGAAAAAPRQANDCGAGCGDRRRCRHRRQLHRHHPGWREALRAASPTCAARASPGRWS